MVTVKFFAVLKKLTGRDSMFIPVNGSTTLKEVYDAIEAEIPQFRSILKEGRALVSINHEMADENSPVSDGDEIAMLPPFAGG